MEFGLPIVVGAGHGWFFAPSTTTGWTAIKI
jgi:hypothetical protein